VIDRRYGKYWFVVWVVWHSKLNEKSGFKLLTDTVVAIT
jgi:hypothetical protein